MDIVLLFPGQGSQKPGMGKDLAAAFPAAATIFEQADATLGFPLTRLCFEGPDDELMATRNAQPALLTHGAAVWATVADRLRPHIRAAAGHSLGEFTAYHAAGAFAFPDALRLVRRRGEIMFESGQKRPGAMAAILGLSEANVEAACARALEEGDVVPANYNTPEQLVISGEVAAVERAMAIAKELGAKRAIRLNVSGAFHSPLMEDAVDQFKIALDAAPIASPDFPVYSNVSAYPSAGTSDAKKLLLRQLNSPVRWTDLVRHIADDVPDALFVEMGPGAVLSTLVKRIVAGARTMTCGTAAEVDQLIGALPT
ncbi:MAG TPA: ACP S-malonyltransferase [Gemmatimonadaceae bacterium]|nr:ACP S-malonyltransferase [Gemmatimonadaceae bacterium]